MKAVLIYISKLLLPENRSLFVHYVSGVGLISVFITGAILVLLLSPGPSGSIKAAKYNNGNLSQLKTNINAGFNNFSEREIS